MCFCFELVRSKAGLVIALYSQVRWYKRLPLRTISRAWGEINSLYLPVWFRKPCFYIYSWLFKCNLEEIDIDDITQFKNLSEFFRRSLKPDARAIDQQSCLVSLKDQVNRKSDKSIVAVSITSR